MIPAGFVRVFKTFMVIKLSLKTFSQVCIDIALQSIIQISQLPLALLKYPDRLIKLRNMVLNWLEVLYSVIFLLYNKWKSSSARLCRLVEDGQVVSIYHPVKRGPLPLVSQLTHLW